MQIARMMEDEFREMYPQFEEDPELKMAFRAGMEGFQSDSLDFVQNNNAHFPLTLVLFYDSTLYMTSIMENLACKILDIFIYKFKRECDEDEYKDFSERIDCHNHNQIYFEEEERKFDFTSNPAMTFESALPLIFEDTLTEYIKELFLNLSCCNLQVPWIYVV